MKETTWDIICKWVNNIKMVLETVLLDREVNDICYCAAA
jgi:hypothetical protein